jgi:hypothetical protein
VTRWVEFEWKKSAFTQPREGGLSKLMTGHMTVVASELVTSFGGRTPSTLGALTCCALMAHPAAAGQEPGWKLPC